MVISFSDPPVRVDVDCKSFSVNLDEKVERLFQVEVLDIHFDELKEYEINFFADYRYCPNQMIFHKVYDALRNLTIQNL